MMAGRGADWRVEADYDYLDELTPEQTAFEFLRRNPDYQDSFQAMRRALDAGDLGAAERLAAGWGLRCWGGPEFTGRSGADRLASRAQPAAGPPRPCACRVCRWASVAGPPLALTNL